MKVFLVSTPRGEGKVRANYKLIYDAISSLGYDHVSDFIASHTAASFYEEMNTGRAAHIKFFNEMVSNIQSADICILEASTPSFGVGFLVQKAIDYSKPTIVLFYENNTPYFLSGIEDEKLIIESYNEKSIKKVLKKVLDQAREKRDKRFNFFLSPKLLNYLENTSNTQGVTKSKILRDMIVDHMRKNNTVVEE